MALDESKKDNDLLSEDNGIKMLVEDKYASYMEGVVIDFSAGGFEISTASSCGDCSCS